MVEARVLRRPAGTVPTWRTLPLLGAVKIVMTLERVVVVLVVSGVVVLVEVADGVVVGAVVPVPVVVPLFAAAAGVTAFDAAEVTELATGVVVLAMAVKV